MTFKSGFVSIVGRPNVGKSSLLNKIVANKVSIVTNKAQTTRNNIRGILTKKNHYQLIFVDTPGIHNSKKELDRIMNASAFKSMKEVELVLFLVPANEKIGKNDLVILNELKNKDVTKFLVITKSDLISKNDLIEKISEWTKIIDNKFSEVLAISVEKDLNIELLKKLIVDFLPANNPQFYDDQTITDQPNRFLIKEIIRENVLLKTGQEVPHSVAILIDELLEDDTKISIFATIVVERKSQKGIIIGAQGKKIKDIKYMSRKQLANIFNKKIELNFFVKVQENWRNSSSLIKRMGYNKDKY